MLHVLRVAFVTFINWGMIAFLCYVVFDGLRTGRIEYGRGRGLRRCRRKRNPLEFWLAVLLYLGLAAMLVLVWWHSVGPAAH